MKHYPVRTELTVAEDLLMRENVTLDSLQAEILERLHLGHQGTTKCRQRAKDSVWWPNIRNDIDEKVLSALPAANIGSSIQNP